MPRYDPIPSNPADTIPASANQIPAINTQPARYQQLTLDSATPSSRRPGGRNPFACGACFEALSQSLSGLFSKIPNRTMISGYVSGFLFAVGWWIFIDGAVFNAVHSGHPTVPGQAFQNLAFEDWVPGVLSTLALFIVNLIDRESLTADDSAYDGTNVAVKARGCAFAGITMALGSVGGALAILSLKYVIPGYYGEALYLGIAITIQNVLIFVSSMVLWFGRNSQPEGQIAL